MMETYSVVRGEVHRAREILAMPVYSIVEGKLLGNIDSLYVRAQDRSVPFVRIGKALSTWHAFLPFSALSTIGVDIALIESESVLREQMTPDELAGFETNLLGRSVLSQSGASVGRLAGFGVEDATGRIVYFRVETSSGFFARLAAMGKNVVEIPNEMVLALGPDAIIVRDDVRELEQ